MIDPGLVADVTVGGALTDVGRSLRESFYMFWDTLWALVIGFGLSGAVQAFVSRAELEARLGDHRLRAVSRAGFFGAVSSSCSYAASAMARSLFAGGADFVTAMVFMFASTNLVIELGIVLAVLMGWQFVAAEVVGGVIMIALLAVAGDRWFRGAALAEASRTATSHQGDGEHEHQEGYEHQDGHEHRNQHGPAAAEPGRPPWRRRARTLAGWSDAAGYTVSDLRMLRKEMLIGFLAAGFLSVLVPVHIWQDVFVHGHGGWTILENAAVGPFVAVISFVCSVGNVPLAAALWKGGISFGGVVSFVFADLITFPLLLIYRKQYGVRMARRMLGVFWAIMALAGLATEGIFHVLGGIPSSRPTVIAGDALRWNATTVLDILALAVLAGLYWLYRHRDRFGGGTGYATDPVCGMQVEVRHAPAVAELAGQRHYFCSEHCRDRYLALQRSAPAPPGGHG